MSYSLADFKLDVRIGARRSNLERPARETSVRCRPEADIAAYSRCRLPLQARLPVPLPI